MSSTNNALLMKIQASQCRCAFPLFLDHLFSAKPNWLESPVQMCSCVS